ncbi:SLC13 family permease [Parasutterella secunda]|uniref:SLC13 family permease n=1 Tax=Parasutterella secunda TaxID=626947 RepID=UPI0021AC3B82|nr:DASS family sodium-coupled anion symporter [Parasutterella secunda]MCR8919910.1 DASS family sodium-coupled anion symporter [Parasutterella secunda]
MKHHESSIEIGAISNKSKLIPLILGPLVALLFYFILPEQYITSAGVSETFSHAARACAAIVLWMAIWWFTEAVPIAVTSLLPIVLFPLFGVMGSSDTLKEYANGTIFLFLGGFLIAAGIARWHLDRRIALLTIRIVGTKPQQIILGLLLSTSFISAWVSNTATAAMMVPIALAVLKVVRSTREDLPIDRAEHNFGVCVLLAVAYGASLGGVLTLIGTPPNGIFARFVEQTYNVPVSFIDWMLIAFPIVVVMIVATQLLMTKVLFRELVSELPGGKDWVMHEYSKLGPMSRGEKIVLTVFVTAALLWCFGPVIRGIQIGDMTPFKALSDTVIAMGAGIILFIIPVDYKRGVHALDWSSASDTVAWDVLLLFGGGLSMAAAIQKTGLADIIGAQATFLSSLPEVAAISGLTTLTVFASEFTSNTALAATMMPLVAAVADSIGMHPEALLVATTFGASLAFMMPVGTPPNAIIFGTGRIRIAEMIRAGFWLNVCGIVVVTIICSVFSVGMIP